MALDTLGGLKTRIASTLMRDDLIADIPDWVTMCEASIRRLLRSQNDVLTVSLASGAATNRYEDLPGDFYDLVGPPRLVRAGSETRPLDFVTPRLMEEQWQSPEVGDPRSYTIVGGKMEFYPQPNGNDIEITYRQGVVALVADGDSNALLLEAPDIYLYGSLIHSAPHLREDERIGTWQTLYTTAIADFNLAHVRKRFAGSPLVMKPRRPIG